MVATLTRTQGLEVVDRHKRRPPTFKISANSRSFNVDVHIYEHCSTEKIDQVIANAVYAMKETQQRIKFELMAEA